MVFGMGGHRLSFTLHDPVTQVYKKASYITTDIMLTHN